MRSVNLVNLEWGQIPRQNRKLRSLNCSNYEFCRRKFPIG
jgi:hypothetical protein